MINLIFKITFFFTFLIISSFYTKVSSANIVVISYESFNNKDFNIKTINEHIKILTSKKYFIYSTNNIEDLNCINGWDGKHQSTGKDVPMGVYIYNIFYQDFEGWKHQDISNITLIR